MSALPNCPACKSEYTYEQGDMYVCPECAHEWSKDGAAENVEQARVWKDSNGNVLQDGDSVTVIKDLEVKGAGQVLRRGTLIKSIRLTDDPQEIDCRYEGIKGLVLRAEFVKKR